MQGDALMKVLRRWSRLRVGATQSGTRLGMEDQREHVGRQLSERWWDVLLAVRMEEMEESGAWGWMGKKEGAGRGRMPPKHVA